MLFFSLLDRLELRRVPTASTGGQRNSGTIDASLACSIKGFNGESSSAPSFLSSTESRHGKSQPDGYPKGNLLKCSFTIAHINPCCRRATDRDQIAGS
jgi:hypothetical protein